MDLVVRNARLRGESGTKDIAVRDGLVAAIGERLAVQAGREIDAGGNLASAPFIDPHLHLDAALSVGDPRYNESGTLLEGIAIWGERRPSLQKNEVLRNAREAVLWEVANGVQFIRTHADTTDSALVTVEALVELREEMKDVAEIQVVAFPQDGVFTFPEGEANLRRALDMGCD